MDNRIDWTQLPPGWKREANAIQELEHSSDRAAAILAATLVDEELSRCLETALATDKKAWKRLFDGNGALSTFSAKIDLARLIGILGPVSYFDLHQIRLIRNKFAHTLLDEDNESLGFGDGQIADWCRSLKTHCEDDEQTPRLQYLRVCLKLYAGLGLYCYSHRSEERMPNLP